MKVLFYTRNDFLTHTGGDTIQILKIKEYLEALGIMVDIASNSHYKLSDYDIIHVYNVIPISYAYEFMKKNRKAKLVLSPIYWDLNEYRTKVLDNIIVKRKIFNFFNNIPLLNYLTNSKFLAEFSGITTNAIFDEKLQFCIDSADLLLTNSVAEQVQMENEFCAGKKTFVIPNGVDTTIKPIPYQTLKARYNLPDEYLLCAGRIEYRKNQLELLRAAKRIGIKVVLVGKINPREKKYSGHLNGYDFIHIPSLNQSELFGLYTGCKAHVLPSWFETPGLATLEAAYAGAQIVTTDRGCTKEYFGEHAYYCDPNDNVSIEKAILNCLNKPKDISPLKEIITNNYTWELAARKTLEAYKQIF